MRRRQYESALLRRQLKKVFKFAFILYCYHICFIHSNPRRVCYLQRACKQRIIDQAIYKSIRQHIFNAFLYGFTMNWKSNTDKKETFQRKDIVWLLNFMST